MLVHLGKPALVLAPMEGITDAPARELLSEIQPWDFCVSKFIRVSHAVPPDHALLRSIPELKNGARNYFWNSGNSADLRRQC